MALSPANIDSPERPLFHVRNHAQSPSSVRSRRASQMISQKGIFQRLNDTCDRNPRWERASLIIGIGTIMLLSLATLCSLWVDYEAAKSNKTAIIAAWIAQLKFVQA